VLGANLRDYTEALGQSAASGWIDERCSMRIQRDTVYVLEVNPPPAVAHHPPYVQQGQTGVPLAKVAARLMAGRKTARHESFPLVENGMVWRKIARAPITTP